MSHHSLWIMDISISLSLLLILKSETMPSTYKSELWSILESYQDYTKFYTDASKIEAGVGTTVIFNEVKMMLKISDSCSIFTAEALAISYALDIIKQNNIKIVIILSDFLSTLTNIQNFF
uniref:RNase H type-1 domain-containing protein n=1 Tax=Sipha flava TaxID=143950 RepID=A0A2S2QDF9_9HEMI